MVLRLSVFSLVGCVLRMNISVAAPFMMTDLHLDKVQMGRIFSAFMLGCALFQVPWGVSGDRVGPGRTLTWAAGVWTATTVQAAAYPLDDGPLPTPTPVIDRMPGVEGFYSAVGFSGHGFKIGPAPDDERRRLWTGRRTRW